MSDSERREVMRVLRQRLASLTRAGVGRVPVLGGKLPEIRRDAGVSEARPDETNAVVASRVVSRAEAQIEPRTSPSPSPSASVSPASVRPIVPAKTAASLFESRVLDAPVLDREAREETLSALSAEVAACVTCSGLASSRTQTVFGVGSPAARLMFIGEAPGADEDRQGEPFVGRAGQLLTDMITKGMGLQRADVYIANILKCRPPNNRDPLPDEIGHCLPYLERQIEIVRPEYLCLLGRIAAQTLLETALPMGRLRGRWHRFRGIPTVVTYHPAALLRNPAWKRETWEDLQMVMRAMGLKTPEQRKSGAAGDDSSP